MEEKVNGVVLRNVSYLEYDSILTLFTAEKGIITCKIKGIKKAGAKLKFAGEPFCFAEYMLAEKQGKRTVTGATLTDGFYAIRDDFEKFMCASVVIEFLLKFCMEGVKSEQLFTLCVKALSYIAYKDNPKRYLSWFLINALSLSGYEMNLETCSSCGVVIESPRLFFDVSGGGFICENCYANGAPEVSKETFLLLADIYNDVEAQPNSTRFLRLLRFLDFYIFNKVGENLKSLKMLLSNPK